MDARPISFRRLPNRPTMAGAARFQDLVNLLSARPHDAAPPTCEHDLVASRTLAGNIDHGAKNAGRANACRNGASDNVAEASHLSFIGPARGFGLEGRSGAIWSNVRTVGLARASAANKLTGAKETHCHADF